MTTQTLTLAEFLLARIEEDRADSRDDWTLAMSGDLWRGYPERAYNALQAQALAHSKRVLAECEARRRIVERLAPYDNINVRRQTRTLAGDTLRDLALPYADHPDFNPEWRP